MQCRGGGADPQLLCHLERGQHEPKGGGWDGQSSEDRREACRALVSLCLKHVASYMKLHARAKDHCPPQPCSSAYACSSDVPTETLCLEVVTERSRFFGSAAAALRVLVPVVEGTKAGDPTTGPLWVHQAGCQLPWLLPTCQEQLSVASVGRLISFPKPCRLSLPCRVGDLLLTTENPN